jgi:CyaY protein
MTESEFLGLADATLARLQNVLEASELDYETPADGIIEIEFDDGGKIVINRHAVARELWLAARAGGFHFRWDGQGWCDTRDGERFEVKLAALIRAQGGTPPDFA